MRFFRQALIGLTLLTLSLGILAYAGSLIKDALTERFAQEARAPQPGSVLLLLMLLLPNLNLSLLNLKLLEK